MNMSKGLFVVLEGIDGAGTTTQSDRLANALQQQGMKVHVTREPSEGPVGMMLRQILKGRMVTPGIEGPGTPSWQTMALLFAADRLDHLEAEVNPHLDQGISVICDRYYHSSLAYQSVTGGQNPEMMEWIKQINSQARRPDLSIILDVHPETAYERRKDRRLKEIYEEEGLQKKLSAFYRKIEKHFPKELIVHIDANDALDSVANKILDTFQENRKKLAFF